MPRSWPPHDDDDFDVTVERVGRELRIAVSGELDLATGPQLVAAVDAHVGRGDPDVVGLVVDLSGVRFIDAAGLRAIVQITAGRHGTIADLSPCVERLFRLTGIPTRFGRA